MPQPYAAQPDDVRAYALQLVAEGTPHLARRIQAHFGVSRATAHNYIRHLLDEGLIQRQAMGHYKLGTTEFSFTHPVPGLEEHEVWSHNVYPLLRDLPNNAIDIWHYGFTEMLNNVVDHSESESISVEVHRTPVSTEIRVHDFGVGIFRKIAKGLDLEDDRHAVLELSKGKVTTDPENHTGEGIFFSSRSFDHFQILSGDVFFDHECDDEEDWILGHERPKQDVKGTSVFMTLRNDSDRNLKDIFDAYATDSEEYRFDRTVVPVKLLEYGDEQLVSRSQAKRLINRFDRFKVVVLNFDNVESIGQAFADEVFRVFPRRHPKVEIVPINANEQVTRMINRARSGNEPQRALFTE